MSNLFSKFQEIFIFMNQVSHFAFKALSLQPTRNVYIFALSMCALICLQLNLNINIRFQHLLRIMWVKTQSKEPT